MTTGTIRKYLLLLGLFLALFTLSCTREKAGSTAVVHFGYLPIASDASFFVALEKGFFTEEGLKVEPTRFESSNQALEALVAGRIEATAVVALEAALALEANTPDQFRVIEMSAATAETKVHRIVVKTDSPIDSLAQLKGKTVGTFPGSQMVVFLKLILGRYFDSDKDVEIVQLKPELQIQALESGQVDALFCLEPTGSILESKGIGRTISMNPLYEYIQKPFPTAVGVVSAKLARENPATMIRIAKALTKAHEYLKTNPQDVAAILPKYVPLDPSIAAKIALYDYWSPESIDRQAVQALTDLYVEKGIIKKPVSTAALYLHPGK